MPKPPKPNGNIRMFPNQRVAGEMARQYAGWKQIAFSDFSPSVDPNVQPSYILDVQGQRSIDNVVFTVRVALNKTKIDMIPNPFTAIKVARESMQNALMQLQTFLHCPCTIDTSCPDHRSQ